MKKIIIPAMLAACLMTAPNTHAAEGAYDLDAEMEYLGIDPNAPAKNEAQKKRALELARRLARKGVKHKDMHESQAWLTSKVHADEIFKVLRDLKCPDEQIEYEILLDLLLRSDNGRAVYSGGTTRLKARKRHESGDLKNSVRRDALISSFASDKQRVKLFHQMLKQEKVRFALAYSKRLVSKRGEDEVKNALLSVINNEQGQLMRYAFDQALAYGYEPEKLKALLLAKAYDAKKMGGGEGYAFVVDQLVSADYLKPAERLDALGAMVHTGGHNVHLSLSGWVGAYRKLETAGALDGVEVKFPTRHTKNIINLLPCEVDMKTSLARQQELTHMEAMALADQITKTGKVSGPIMAGLLTRDWPMSEGDITDFIFMEFKDKQAMGQAVADALPAILESKVTLVAWRKLADAVYYDAKASPKHMNLLRKEFDKQLALPRIHLNRMGHLLSLMASTGDKTAVKILVDILNGSHPINDKLSDKEREGIHSLALYEIGNFGAVVTQFEKMIAANMNKKFFHTNAAGALRGWPAHKRTGDELRKAIEAQLIKGMDTPLQTNGRGIHTFGFDPKKTTTLKLELLSFIEAGGNQRIKRYKKALKVVANLEPQKRVQLKKSSNVVAAELLKRIR